MSVNKTARRKLVIKSRTENLSEIREFISSAADNVGFTKEITDNIILAVDEACTNIIKHAYQYFPDGEIILILKTAKDTFTIEITDHGKSFEPGLIPNPDLKKYLDQRRVGGLGMYLMKTLMDEIKYKTVPGKFNMVSLTKNINSNGSK